MEEKMRLEKLKSKDNHHHPLHENDDKDKDDRDKTATIIKTDDKQAKDGGEERENVDQTHGNIDHNQDQSGEDNNVADNHIESTVNNIDKTSSNIGEQSSERNRLIDDEIDIEEGAASHKSSFTSHTNDNLLLATTTATTTDKPTSGLDSPSTTKSTAIYLNEKQEEEAKLPISFRPIVVSSTMGTDYEDEEYADKVTSTTATITTVKATAPDGGGDYRHFQSQGSTERTPYRNGEEGRDGGNKDSMKVTVEKVEIIEIKSDGSTGHFIPPIFMQSTQTKGQK